MKKGFTLIELLVVIAIISMLAGQLLPALSTAREKGRQANCTSNLHQFSIALEMYYDDFNNYPPWLSTLYPSYLDNKGVFVCITDPNKGTQGDYTQGTGNLYPNTNDIGGNTLTGGNSAITANSYLYLLNPGEDTPWELANPGVLTSPVSWAQASMWEISPATTPTSGGGIDQNKLPMVQCFWHNLVYGQRVINLGYKNYNVFISGPNWEQQ